MWNGNVLMMNPIFLDQIPWIELHHVYGSAIDVPEQKCGGMALKFQNLRFRTTISAVACVGTAARRRWLRVKREAGSVILAGSSDFNHIHKVEWVTVKMDPA